MKSLVIALAITAVAISACPTPRGAQAQMRPQMMHNGQELEMNCEQIEHGMSVSVGVAQAMTKMMEEKNCVEGQPECVSETHSAGEALRMFIFLDRMREWQCTET